MGGDSDSVEAVAPLFLIVTNTANGNNEVASMGVGLDHCGQVGGGGRGTTLNNFDEIGLCAQGIITHHKSNNEHNLEGLLTCLKSQRNFT